jgi:predicted dinucleotide-binding enzyme
VGTGNIGGALARAWIRAGHAVRVAVRDASAPDVAALVALGAEATPVGGAAEGAEVVALAVPAGTVASILPSLGALDGRVVIDATNPIGPGFTLVHGHTTSGAEQLAARIPGARVVKSFNQQGAELLSAPRFDGVPATNFVAGDDEAARRVVMSLTEDVGLEAMDAGPLSRARLLEPLTFAWIAASRALGTREIGLAIVRR